MAAAPQIEVTSPAESASRFEPEFELLLACCRQQPDLSRLELPAPNWGTVLGSAEHHRLIPALYAALVSQSHASIHQMRDAARAHAWRALRFTAELKRTAQHFDRRRIQYLAYKGPALAQLLYGDVTKRQFGDLDLLVRPQDVPRAREALIQLDYEQQLSLSAKQEQFYLRTGYEYAFRLGTERHVLELQWQIVPQFCSIGLEIDSLFDRSIQIELEGLPLRTLGREDLMIVLCIHAAKHQWSQLGMLRDIATLSEFDLDWRWITSETRRLGVLKILQISLLAISKLFGFELPAACEPASLFRDVAEFTSQLVQNLRGNREPNTESLEYFLTQAGTRERWRDRARFFWRLATNPSISEWETVRLPDALFRLYRAIRIARLTKRFARAIF